jgi:SAM-dependent methyltransferase
VKSVLNVGGSSKAIAIPAYYTGWQHHLLDIDPRGKPDVCMDARELRRLPGGTYDAIYCSHNLEHYHRADGAKVLEGFAHVLKDDGFVEIRVPDVLAVMKHAVQNNMDLDDTLYMCPSGPIMVRDVFYGYSLQVEKMGNEFFAHKTGFSPQSLAKFVSGRGFAAFVILSHNQFEITAYLFKRPATLELWKMLNLNPAQFPGGTK